MPSAEFWALDFRELEALGERRRQIWARDVNSPQANICRVLGDIHRDREQHPEPFELDDFLLALGTVKEPEPELDGNQLMVQKLRALTLALGGTIIEE